MPRSGLQVAAGVLASGLGRYMAHGMNLRAKKRRTAAFASSLPARKLHRWPTLRQCAERSFPNMTQPVPRRPSCSAHFLAMTLYVFPTDFFPPLPPWGSSRATRPHVGSILLGRIPTVAKVENTLPLVSRAVPQGSDAWLSWGHWQHVFSDSCAPPAAGRLPRIGVCQALPERREQVRRRLGRTHISIANGEDAPHQPRALASPRR